MIIVKVFGPFRPDLSPDYLYQEIKENFNFDREGIRLTNDDDYTHAVVINDVMPELKVQKDKVIGLAWEPNPFLNLTPQFINWCQEHVSAYYIGQKGNLPDPFIEHFNYKTRELIREPLKPKTKFASIIFSGKNMLYGHKYRNTLVVECLRRGLPVDVYGRGCGLLSVNDSRIKGGFERNSATPYNEYLFHFAIENCSINEYVSEKILNCFYTNTIPIYYGAKKINDYFPNSCIQLTGSLERDIPLIIDIFQNPGKYIQQIDIRKYKDHIETADLANHLLKKFGTISDADVAANNPS